MTIAVGRFEQAQHGGEEGQTTEHLAASHVFLDRGDEWHRDTLEKGVRCEVNLPIRNPHVRGFRETLLLVAADRASSVAFASESNVRRTRRPF